MVPRSDQSRAPAAGEGQDRTGAAAASDRGRRHPGRARDRADHLLPSPTAKGTAPEVYPAASGIPCDPLEHTQTHYHAALQIIYQGNQADHPERHRTGLHAPASTGCTCTPNHPDVIHIESPKGRHVHAGPVLQGLGRSSKGTPEPLDATHVSTFTLTRRPEAGRLRRPERRQGAAALHGRSRTRSSSRRTR